MTDAIDEEASDDGAPSASLRAVLGIVLGVPVLWAIRLFEITSDEAEVAALSAAENV